MTSKFDKKIVGTHYGASIGPNIEDFKNDPLIKGLFTGDGYLSRGISHQSNTRALNALFGTSFLPSQVLGQNCSWFLSVFYGGWAYALVITDAYVWEL